MGVAELINIVPDLLSYYVPGYIAFYIFARMTKAVRVDKDGIESKGPIPCIVISFLTLIPAKIIAPGNNTEQDKLIQAAWAMGIAVVASVLISLLRGVKIYPKHIPWTTQTLIYTSIWDEFFCNPDGRKKTIRVYTKYNGHDARIEGVVNDYEVTEEGTCWVTIKGYKVFYKESESIEPDYSVPDDAQLIIHVKDVGTIESI